MVIIKELAHLVNIIICEYDYELCINNTCLLVYEKIDIQNKMTNFSPFQETVKITLFCNVYKI